MNKDIAVKLALELNNEDIVSLCLTSKLFNKYICENEYFWLNKIRKDYPSVKDMKKYGKSYREIYKNLHQKVWIFIAANITHDSEEEDTEEDEIEEIHKEINIGGEFEFELFWDIKNIIKSGLEDFFQRVALYGYYTLKINNEQFCDFSKYLSTCLEYMNEIDDIEEISVTLDTVEYINEEDEDFYDEMLKESIQDSINEYKKNK